jgi:hypothetical protein
VVRLPGGALVRRAVTALCARVGHPHQVAEAATLAGQLRIDAPVLQRPARRSRGRECAAGDDIRGALPPGVRARIPRVARAAALHQPTDGPRAALPAGYRSADLARSAKLDAAADQLYQEGTAAKSYDDRYILSTVFFAAVLFFAGISLRLDWRPLRIAVLGMALTLLIGGVAFVLTLPVA